MDEKELQELVKKLTSDDSLNEKLSKVINKYDLKELIDSYDSSINIDDNSLQKLFEKLQNFFKSPQSLSLDSLNEVTGGQSISLYDRTKAKDRQYFY